MAVRAVTENVAALFVPPSLIGWSTHATIARRSAPIAALMCIAAVTLPRVLTAAQRCDRPEYIRDSTVPDRSHAASTSPEALTATATERMWPRPEMRSVAPGALTPDCRTT